MKTRQDNNLTDHIGTVYVENETDLQWSIGSGAICDKNQIRQLRDRSYKSNLYEKQNKLSWPIGPGVDCDENQIRQRRDWSYRCVLCQKQNWDVVTDCISAVYTENEIELLWPIKLVVVYDENQTW